MLKFLGWPFLTVVVGFMQSLAKITLCKLRIISISIWLEATVRLICIEERKKSVYSFI